MFSHVTGTKLNANVKNYQNLPLCLYSLDVEDNAMYKL